jgi:predicted type IV restriction endonuclease
MSITSIAELKDRIEEFSKTDLVSNEANTKKWIIEPLLEYLGWHFHRREIIAERRVLDGGWVDYSLQLSGKKIIFVEAKPFSHDLAVLDNNQAISYGKQEDVRWVVISNGRFLKIFDTSRGNQEKDCLFSELDLRNLPNKLDELMLISHQSILDGKLEQKSADIFSKKQTINLLKSEKDNIHKEIKTIIHNHIGNLEINLDPIVDMFFQQLLNSLEGRSIEFVPYTTPLSRDVLIDNNSVNRSELQNNNEGEVVICPSKQNGIDFLKKYNAWGFVTLSNEHSKTAKYLGIYISDPVSSVLYFGEISSISNRLSSKEEVSWIKESDMREFDIGKRIIILKQSSLKQLNDPIPAGLKRKGLQGKFYCSLRKFIQAKNLDDL